MLSLGFSGWLLLKRNLSLMILLMIGVVKATQTSTLDAAVVRCQTVPGIRNNNAIVVLKPEQINDGYCDCIYSGEDETETDACAGYSSWPGNDHINAQYQQEQASRVLFTCPQQPDVRLSVSKLNDGICDCCDGSDEVYEGSEEENGTFCADTCEEVLRSVREAHARKVQNFNLGSETRKRALEEYQRLFQQVQADVTKKRMELLEREQQKSTLTEQLITYKANFFLDRTQRMRSIVSQSSVNQNNALQIIHDVFRQLNMNELQWMLVYACQLAGELLTPSHDVNDAWMKTCVPLRLAGLDHGIQWEAGTYQLKRAITTTMDDKTELFASFADLIAYNMDRSSINEKVWSTKMLNSKSNHNYNSRPSRKSRRLSEYEHDDDDIYSDSSEEEYEDYPSDNRDSYTSDSDYANSEDDLMDETVSTTHSGSYVDSTTSALDEISETSNRDELVAKIKSMVLSQSRVSFLEQSEKLLDYVNQLEQELQTQQDIENDKKDNVSTNDNTNEDTASSSDQEGTSDIDPNPNGSSGELSKDTPVLDPIAFTTIRNNVESRKKRIECGYSYAVSALVLVDAVVDEMKLLNPNTSISSGESHQSTTRELLEQLIIGTIYYGQLSQVHLYQILQAILPDLGPSSDDSNFTTMTCSSLSIAFCPPITVLRESENGKTISYPPTSIVTATESFCIKKQNELLDSGEQGGFCSLIQSTEEKDWPQHLPADIPDVAFGYTIIPERSDDDPFHSIFGDEIFKNSDAKFRTELETFEEKLQTIENEIRSIQDNIKELEGSVGEKFGPDGELHSVRDKCFEIEAGKYIYELCIFGSAKQRDIGTSAGMGTNLGRWDGYDNTFGEKSYRAWKWSNGDKCWNGPHRSATLTVLCGTEHKILSADEPSTCRYVFEMESPIGCDEEYRVVNGL